MATIKLDFLCNNISFQHYFVILPYRDKTNMLIRKGDPSISIGYFDKVQLCFRNCKYKLFVILYIIFSRLPCSVALNLTWY